VSWSANEMKKKHDLGIKIWAIVFSAAGPLVADNITKHIMKAIEEDKK